MVGLEGFEPPTSCTPCKRATRLRYSPKKEKREDNDGGWRGSRKTNARSSAGFSAAGKALVELPEKRRDELGFEVSKSGFEALAAVERAKPGLDRGGLAEGSEKLVRREPGEERLPIETLLPLGMSEDPLAGEEAEDGIADPGKFSLARAVFHGRDWAGGGTSRQDRSLRLSVPEQRRWRVRESV